jgi:glycosyltransferase involved in cell wall biosynthesis
MRNIVFIHLYNDRSGSPKVLSQVISAISDKKIPFEVLTSSHTGGFLSEYKEKTTNIFYQRADSKIITLFYYLISQTYLFFFCLKYWRKDTVFYINTLMPFGASLAGKLMGKTVYYHLHETSIRPIILKEFLKKVVSITASKVVYVSNFLAEREKINVTSQVIYNAIDNDFLSKANSSSHIKKPNPGGFNVLMVCSLKTYKGVLEFIQLANLLRVNPIFSFTLVLNADQIELDNFFSSMEISKNMEIYSRQTDLSRFYCNADCLLNLSRVDQWIETFGLTIIEGMSYGLPIICPPIGGPCEIVSDNIEGFLISSYDLSSVESKLLLLSENNQLYFKMSDKAKIKSETFSIQEFNRKILRFLMHDRKKS